ncbi:hypothetical protein RDWZM_006637 [Blomia tropicalis]|uniref:GTP-binding protein Rhes n=1 Tax=Blomia tropicalis TaxID=40697 RepID=A0A9Q0RNS3_BLOTA|nr:hypothetical protein BLOT_008352 [Blomia tropicalis]KAJ6220825.1 hypothetical protein RDWZM_006637 [Blomia tropicalis]
MPPSLSLSKLAFHSPWHHHTKEKIILHYRVVILGGARVGKTSIVRRLLSETFPGQHVPTVEELYQIEYKMRNMDLTLLLDLLDTSGSYPFPAMRDLAIRSGDAFLLVYSVDDQSSYDEMIRLKDLIYELRGENMPPIVVVANKTDLSDSRVIDTNLTDSIISIDWEFGHVECSAKTNENVARIFTQLLRQKILMEKQLEKRSNSLDSELDSASSSGESDVSPSRSSISSSEKLFFADDFHGSSNSLDMDSRKSSITDSELEFRLKNGFKNSNCIIS